MDGRVSFNNRRAGCSEGRRSYKRRFCGVGLSAWGICLRDLPGIFSLPASGRGWRMDGRERRGTVTSLFFSGSFLRLLRLLREALVGLRLVWVLERGGRKEDGDGFG